MPAIFQHFTEHQQDDMQISMLSFLEMHYLHGSPKDKDYDKDMQLPFKASGDYSASFANAFFNHYTIISVYSPILEVKNKEAILQNKYLLSAYLSNIWQPPKSC